MALLLAALCWDLMPRLYKGTRYCRRLCRARRIVYPSAQECAAVQGLRASSQGTLAAMSRVAPGAELAVGRH